MDTQYISAKAKDLLLLIGTTKGAFLLRTTATRSKWSLAGPFCQGESVYALCLDQRRGRQRLWAAARNEHYATELVYSDDFGKTWQQPTVPLIAFPADCNMAVERIWQVVLGADDDTLYCGVAPAALFVSRDAGASWQLVRGLFDHPHRTQWNPGAGGLCLHTILPHPQDRQKITVAISAGGVYKTSDGGKTWKHSNKGLRADFNPVPYPEFGQCVHKIARDNTLPERLFLQNHGGLYRSDDDGETWNDIGKGVPSDFGFALAVHPRKANTAYIVPLEGQMRVTPSSKTPVYRTTNGKSWSPLGKELSKSETFETVLRDGMCTDNGKPLGIYYGTRSGKVVASLDEGKSWKTIWQGLPPVVCVKAAQL